MLSNKQSFKIHTLIFLLLYYRIPYIFDTIFFHISLKVLIIPRCLQVTNICIINIVVIIVILALVNFCYVQQEPLVKMAQIPPNKVPCLNSYNCNNILETRQFRYSGWNGTNYQSHVIIRHILNHRHNYLLLH